MNGRWTTERNEFLKLAYAQEVFPDTILEALHGMSGPALTWEIVRERAKTMGYKRPLDFLSRHTIDRVKAKWSPERISYLATAYKDGVFPEKILAALNELPGEPIEDWQVVKTRAKHTKLKRPKGFLQTLGKAHRWQQ
jgi:hypothetical protein